MPISSVPNRETCTPSGSHFCLSAAAVRGGAADVLLRACGAVGLGALTGGVRTHSCGLAVAAGRLRRALGRSATMAVRSRFELPARRPATIPGSNLGVRRAWRIWPSHLVNDARLPRSPTLSALQARGQLVPLLLS